MKNKNVRLKEISFELGLSINTVSRALRDCSDISKKTKEIVIQKAIEFGYMPNIISQSLKNDNKKCVAILINNFKNLFFISMYDQLATIFKKYDWDFTIIYSHEKTVSLDIVKQCISQRVDGIISFFEFEEDSIEFAKYNNIATVFLGKSTKDLNISQIYTDDIGGGYIAANYLLHYHNLNDFVYFGYGNNQNSIDRFASFKETILKNRPNSNIYYVEYKDDMEVDIIQYMQEGKLGIFGFNDEMIYSILNIINKKIPNFRKVFPKVHIVGFDSISTRVKGLIDITSIDFDYELMCSKCMEILQDTMNNKDNEIKKVSIPTKLHQRIYF